MSIEAAWTHNSNINGEELNPSNTLWARQCIYLYLDGYGVKEIQS